jgi:hypothetical protein
LPSDEPIPPAYDGITEFITKPKSSFRHHPSISLSSISLKEESLSNLSSLAVGDRKTQNDGKTQVWGSQSVRLQREDDDNDK